MDERIAGDGIQQRDEPVVMDAVMQPIVSVARRSVIGFEGLSRGNDRLSGEPIPITDLFDEARATGTILEFDRACRERCMQRFFELRGRSDKFYLFINLDTSVLDIVNNSDYLYEQTQRHGIPPEQVVIEINEARMENTERLIEFVEMYKRFGFLIALDDIGVGYSNLERLAIVQPNIVKLDRSLIDGIERSYYKQEIFRSMVHLAAKIGAIVVAEGVETEEQANAALEFGAHMLQGYLFSRPLPVCQLNGSGMQHKIDSYARTFANHIHRKIYQQRQSRHAVDSLVNGLTRALSQADIGSFAAVLSRFAAKSRSSGVECVYVLNRAGLQVSDTVFVSSSIVRPMGTLFYPAEKGANHELKPYYYEMLNGGMSRYVSAPYISHASGNACDTHARLFTTPAGEEFILCMDILHSRMNG